MLMSNGVRIAFVALTECLLLHFGIEVQHELLLARDHLGIKPLYYTVVER